ncbi:M61 family metallopeptidase [Lysobacter sp. Root983]|uniref:M61 family metallopeptidase n=1 Tax=Lysobacter sp. Root983 TaxID=1736613 RepID=UPI0007101773|nr:M61 family metallopeptidase [Lysobacter sp. Root983]KRD73616.1 peptidase M61 [Lysobacter sp. Root983]
MPHRPSPAVLPLLIAALLPLSSAAQTAPLADTPYPGTLTLEVDATDVAHRVFRSKQRIPVQPGPLTLLYPQWLPGNHSPTGPINKLAGLVVTGNGQRIAWTRDPLDVYAFKLVVPEGVSTIELAFDYLSPTGGEQGRVVMSQDLLSLQWNAVALYPAGHAAGRIQIAPSLKLPAGWQSGTALEVESREGDTLRYKPVSFETLVDSPLFAGRYYRQIDLAPGAKVPVRLNMVADHPKYLEAKPEQLAAHRRMVEQAMRLFRSQHYDRYDFLFSLSDQIGGIGLEHHRSSENGVDPEYFTDWDKSAVGRDLLAHEYTHSWNGKFRRPADLATPNFNVPMQDSLLWVYEGQTQYWGYVLTARAGMWKPQTALDALAMTVAAYTTDRPGFAWRNVQDTTNDPIIGLRRPQAYRSQQLSEEYYSAGQLIWLTVDAKLRELSRDKRSLDDFAAAFFGVDDGSYAVKPYTFDDVVATLNAVAPHDWAAFLRQRLDANAAPLDGLAASGWKLVYTDKPNDYVKQSEGARKVTDLNWSLGLIVSNKDATLSSVRWDGPAFNAGLAPGSTLLAVNGYTFEGERLKDAITAAKDKGEPIELVVKQGEAVKTVRIDYREGLKYPSLERIPGTPDRLSKILAPK